jgi:hypothetical protein
MNVLVFVVFVDNKNEIIALKMNFLKACRRYADVLIGFLVKHGKHPFS